MGAGGQGVGDGEEVEKVLDAELQPADVATGQEEDEECDQRKELEERHVGSGGGDDDYDDDDDDDEMA